MASNLSSPLSHVTIECLSLSIFALLNGWVDSAYITAYISKILLGYVYHLHRLVLGEFVCTYIMSHSMYLHSAALHCVRSLWMGWGSALTSPSPSFCCMMWNVNSTTMSWAPSNPRRVRRKKSKWSTRQRCVCFQLCLQGWWVLFLLIRITVILKIAKDWLLFCVEVSEAIMCWI